MSEKFEFLKKMLFVLIICLSSISAFALTLDASKFAYSLAEAGKIMTDDYRLVKVSNYSEGSWSEDKWREKKSRQYSLIFRKKPYYELTDSKGKVLWKKDLPLSPPYNSIYDNETIYPSEENVAMIDETMGETVALLYDQTRNRYYFMDKTGKETFLPDNSGHLQSYGKKYGKYWLFMDEGGFHTDYKGQTFFPEGRGFLIYYPETGKIRQGTFPALPMYFTEFISTPNGDGFFFLYHYNNKWETSFYSTADSVYKVCPEVNSLRDYAFSPGGEVAIIKSYNNTNYSEYNLIVDARTGETLGKINNTKSLGAVADKSSGLVFIQGGGQNLVLNYLTGQLVFIVPKEIDMYRNESLEISANGDQINCQTIYGRIYYGDQINCQTIYGRIYYRRVQ